MMTLFDCPVCGAQKWKTAKTFHYHRTDHRSYDRYIALRRRILFEIWFPGQDRVSLQTIYCQQCGFVNYQPRPSKVDVEAKYRFLQAEERDIGGCSKSNRGRSEERLRAQRIFYKITQHMSNKQMDVLDFAGGNGKMLLPFIESGHSPFLVDYSLCPLPGVNKIGDTIEDISPDRRFHAIICSHVLEHVSEPVWIVRRLFHHLSQHGIIFAEVPMQVFGGIPIEIDPVTHINFFTLISFMHLFVGQGLHLLEAEQTLCCHGKRRQEVLTVVGRKGTPPPFGTIPVNGSLETELLMRRPSLFQLIQHNWRLRRMPTVRWLLRRLTFRFQ